MAPLALRLALVATVLGLAAHPAVAAPPPFGGLSELPGCLSGTGSGGFCTVARAISADGYPESAMSPDGKNVYMTASNDGAVAVLALDPLRGVLTQLPGTAGCISADGSGGQCATDSILVSPAGAAVSPDGRNVYVGLADNAAGGVAAFARDASTGALTPLPGEAACINENGSGGCAPGNGLSEARSVVVSPDGRNVYVAARNDNAVAAFSREPASGALTQLPGMAGCTTSAAATGCGPGRALMDPWSVEVSPDGENVYVMTDVGNAIAVFSRSPGSGALTQSGGTAGCISTTGNGGTCATNALVQQPRVAAFSPDGADLYVTMLSPGDVIGFSRDVTTGALTQLPGQGGCVSATGSGGLCAKGTALVEANGVAVSPDGRSIYVVSIDPTNSVSAFDRDTSSGAIAQLPGQAACVSEDGTAGACADGVALVSATWAGITPDGSHVVVDGLGDSGNIALYNRELPPVCSPFSRTIASGVSTPLTLPCSDPNGDPISRSIVGAPQHGKLGTLDQSLGSLPYTPGVGFLGSDSFTFAASDGTLTSAAATAGLVVQDKVAPSVSRVSISPRKFAAKGAHAARVKRGALIRYRLSEAATVAFTIQRRVKKKRRTRFVNVGSFKLSSKSGSSRKAFSGRIRGKALKPAAYRLVLRATDASKNRSKQRRIAFRIVRAR